MQGANYIDGRWVDGATPFTTQNPSDLDETVGSYTKVGEAEVREAMAAARRAQPSRHGPRSTCRRGPISSTALPNC